MNNQDRIINGIIIMLSLIAVICMFFTKDKVDLQKEIVSFNSDLGDPVVKNQNLYWINSGPSYDWFKVGPILKWNSKESKWEWVKKVGD